MSPTATWSRLAGAALFWAAMFHLGKYAVSAMSPLAIGAWRFLIAGAILLPMLQWREGLDWRGVRANRWPLLAMAVLGICGFNVALFYGLKHTSPVNGALIVALNPAITTVLSALLHREPIRARQWAGLLLGIAGVAVVVSHGSLAALRALSFSMGDVLVLLAATGWAIYSVVPRRFVQGLAPLQITTSTIVLGGLVLAGTAGVAGADLFAVPPTGVILAVLVMSVFGSALAYVWWNDAVSRIGAAKAVLFMNLVPVFATLIGVALGQPVSGAQWVGAALVISGVLYATRQPAARPSAAVTLPLARQAQ